MNADDWQSRLEAYTRQGRSDDDIRAVVAHLNKRGPGYTREQQVARAQKLGYVSRVEYMAPDVEAQSLALGADGFPDARLERVRDRLVVVTPRGWVYHRSRTAYRAGLHFFILRGTAYNAVAAKAGRFTPGTPVRLEREPNNPHDANAIAVYAAGAPAKSGYVPRGTAKRLAKLLDAGADLVGITLRGSDAGEEGPNPQVLVCERALFEHLMRDSR